MEISAIKGSGVRCFNNGKYDQEFPCFIGNSPLGKTEVAMMHVCFVVILILCVRRWMMIL